MDASDAELLAAWTSGDNKAGAALFRRHFGSLRRFFGNKLGSTAEVEDLVQQTLVGCVTARERFRGDASFRTFLFAVARNTLLKFLRDRKPSDSLDPSAMSLADRGLGPSTALGLRREQRLLLTALRHICIDDQIVLELYYWERLQAKQIAAVLGTTEAAVRGRLRTAKLQLRAALDDLAHDPAELRSTVGDLERWAESLRDHWA